MDIRLGLFFTMFFNFNILLSQSMTSCQRSIKFVYGVNPEVLEIECLTVSDDYNLFYALNNIDSKGEYYHHNFSSETFNCTYSDKIDGICFDDLLLVIDTLNFEFSYPELSYYINRSIFKRINHLHVIGKQDFKHIESTIKANILVEYYDRSFQLFDSIQSIKKIDEIYNVRILPKALKIDQEMEGIIEFPSIKLNIVGN